MIAVSSLLNALERDVYSAADRCWRLQDRPLQLRGGLIRSKNVVLQASLACSVHTSLWRGKLGGRKCREQHGEAELSIVSPC